MTTISPFYDYHRKGQKKAGSSTFTPGEEIHVIQMNRQSIGAVCTRLSGIQFNRRFCFAIDFILCQLR